LSTKLLAIVGSPRKGGNIDVLVDEALDAFCKDGGNAEKVILKSLPIRPRQQRVSCMKVEGLDSI